MLKIFLSIVAALIAVCPAQARELVSKPLAFNAGVLWIHCGINCTDRSAIAEK